MELPSSHRVPAKWIAEHACAPIRWRTVTEILPKGLIPEPELAALRREMVDYRLVKQIVKKQAATGMWGRNMLGIAPSAAQDIKAVGTIAQYRRLRELGLPESDRSFRLADRLLFRILSKDEDPALLFEYKKLAKTNAALALWARNMITQGATAALAEGGRKDDPRLRGAAHRIMSQVSQFLRSDLADSPIVRKGSRNILHPDAFPPTVFCVAAVAYLPAVQRERAGFVERLCAFLGKPGPKRTYTIQVGKKIIKPTFTLLGNPLHADSSGRPKDLPFALHWIELLARMGAVETSPTAIRILTRLFKDCDAQGVWSPKGLRSLPKSPSKLADFAFPLEADTRTADRRKSDVTFRLALIAKVQGLDLEFE